MCEYPSAAEDRGGGGVKEDPAAAEKKKTGGERRERNRKRHNRGPKWGLLSVVGPAINREMDRCRDLERENER